MGMREVLQVDLEKETISLLVRGTERQEEASMPYEQWLDSFLDSERDIFPKGASEKLISVESLRKIVREEENDRILQFRRGRAGRKWYEVRIMVGWGANCCILAVREIHAEFIKKRKKLRNDLYRSVYERLRELQQYGMRCGIVITDTSDYRVVFADRRARAFLKQPEFQKEREALVERVRGLAPKGMERDLLEGGYSASDCFQAKSMQGQSEGVSLHSYCLTMESGRQYQYLLYAVVTLEEGALKPARIEAGNSSFLTELVESYLFEWNIEDNHVTLTDNWDSKFFAVRQEKYGFRKIENYVYEEDIPKVRRMFNAILSGNIEDNTMARFYVENSDEKSCINWCNISLISVLYDGTIPMYVVGSIRDISSKLRLVMDNTLNGHGVSKEMTGRARLLVEHLIQKTPDGVKHAFMVLKMNSFILESEDTGMEILVFQYMELVTRMIYPDDIVWLDESNLMLFLRNVGSSLNARRKAERICRVLENRECGELPVDIGVAMYPDDGLDFERLMSRALEDLQNNRDSAGNRPVYRENEPEDKMIGAYSSMNILTDILDEWYRTIKTNNLLKEKMELTKAQLMLSQIKPHFIYNVLANIKSLIYSDADKAADVVVAFTKYLRVQLNALGEDEMAPFSEILDFVRNYVEIEKSRFPGKINVKYEIEYEDFKIPHFILQPVVENAIKHGICKRETAGTLTICSRREDGWIIIQVGDDGVGYEADQERIRGKDHGVGLENVRMRLKHLVRGEIQTESVPGIGTRVTIRIPEKRQERK